MSTPAPAPSARARAVAEHPCPWFRAHKEVLYFASAFFQAALSGGWAETERDTARPQSMSSVITISQPPTVPGGSASSQRQSEITFAPMDPDLDPDELAFDVDIIRDDLTDGESELSSEDKAKAREDSLSKLEQSSPATPTSPTTTFKGKAKAPDVDGKPPASLASRTLKRRQTRLQDKRPDAIIVLKEEKVGASGSRVDRVH